MTTTNDEAAANEYAGMFVCPLNGGIPQTPYERGAIRQVAQHHLAGQSVGREQAVREAFKEGWQYGMDEIDLRFRTVEAAYEHYLSTSPDNKEDKK